MGKIRTYMKALLPLLLFFILEFFAVTVITAIFISMSVPYEEPQYQLVMLAVSNMLAICVMGWWYYFSVADSQERRRASSRKRLGLRGIGGVVLLALGTQLLAGLLLALWNLFAPGMTADYGQLLEGAGVMETNALSVLVTVALGPLWEELVFRGLMMEYLRRAGAGLWKANMIQALLFGLIHVNLVQGSYAWLLGIALGYIVWKCGALFPGIFMHVIFNAYGMIEPLLLERIFGPELTTGALVLYGVVSGAAGAALGLCGLKLLQGAVLQKNAEATE